MPERATLQENLFKNVTSDSDTGKLCLQAMISLCVGTSRVAYYPGLLPENAGCPICQKQMERYVSPQSPLIFKAYFLVCIQAQGPSISSSVRESPSIAHPINSDIEVAVVHIARLSAHFSYFAIPVPNSMKMRQTGSYIAKTT